MSAINSDESVIDQDKNRSISFLMWHGKILVVFEIILRSIKKPLNKIKVNNNLNDHINNNGNDDEEEECYCDKLRKENLEYEKERVLSSIVSEIETQELSMMILGVSKYRPTNSSVSKCSLEFNQL